MATLIKADGTEQEIPTPRPGELAKLIGCDLFDCARTTDGRSMFVDDEGHAKGLPLNRKATQLYGGGWPILGNVVVFSKEETRRDREEL